MKNAHVILGLAAVLAATGAAAEPQVMRTVTFADLNLESDTGIAALERRVVRTARAMCDINPAMGGAALDAERNACIAQTVEAARASMEAAVRAQRSARLASVSVQK